jgi:hypothetical protein
VTRKQHQAGSASVVLTADSTTKGALRINVTAIHTEVESTWRTLFNFSGLTCLFHASSVNVAAPGADELVVPSIISFNNGNGLSQRCSQGVYMTSASPGYASWPLNTAARLTFEVDARGHVSVPSINGVPFEAIAFPDNGDWITACEEVVLSASDALYVGATGATGGGEDFVGSIADVTIERIGA